mgnify:CR=1 FL=1
MSIIIPANSAVGGGFDVDNSLRFNKTSSDYLTKTFGSAGNRKTWTWSGWLKRSSNFASQQDFFAVSSGSAAFHILYFSGNDTITFNYNTTYVETNRKFRDASAWYHVVIACDTTQSTSSNRVKIYINGVQETSMAATGYPSQNADLGINNNVRHDISNQGAYYSNNSYFDGYMAEVCFIDGTALDPTSFGEFDSDSNIWKPIDVSGLTFGNNGFYLDFENSGALGADVSGNSNNFTVNNLTAIDQSTDTCTNNFATLNPLNSSSNDSHTPPTYSEGNLQSASPSSGGGYVGSSTIGVTNGKWFWEFKKSGGSATNIYNGIGNEVGTAEIARQSAVGVYFGNQVFYRPDGTKQIITNGSNANSSYGASWTTNDIIGIALDLDSSTNTVTFYKNGASQGAINLPVNTDTWFFIVACGTDTVDTWQLNFGSPPYAISSGNTDGNGYGNFEYAVPSGYFSLNTKNLAEYG